MAVNEDEPSFKASGGSENRAKLLLKDQADYNTQHIFFDDMYHRNSDDHHSESEQNIVDVRDVITGEKIPKRKSQDMYVIHVHPHRAILEPEYFIKKYEDAEV